MRALITIVRDILFIIFMVLSIAGDFWIVNILFALLGIFVYFAHHQMFGLAMLFAVLVAQICRTVAIRLGEAGIL